MDEPTITAVVVEQLVRTAEDHGLDGDEGLAHAGLRRLVSARFDDRVPVERAAAVAAWGVRHLGRDFGLLAGASPGLHGPLWFLAGCQATLADALEVAVRFWPLVRDDARWATESDRGELRLVHPEAPEGPGRAALIDFELASLCRTTRALAGRPPQLEVRLPRCASDAPARRGPAPWGRWADTRSGWPRAEIVVPRPCTRQSLDRHDEGLSRFLKQDLERQLASRRSRPGLPERVRRRLERTDGRDDRARVARALGMSERSLNRRLDAEGTSFREIADQVRFERAVRWLDHHTVAQVAARLGFADARSLRRAFQRWAGCSPARWRERSPLPAARRAG